MSKADLTGDGKKRRKRRTGGTRKGKLYPPLPLNSDGERAAKYAQQIAVNIKRGEHMPRIDMFEDSLHYYQTLLEYSKAMVVVAEKQTAKLSKLSKAERDALAAREREAKAAQNALQSEAAKELVKQDPSQLLELFKGLDDSTRMALQKQLEAVAAMRTE